MTCPECGAAEGERHDDLCWTAHDIAGTESMSAASWRAPERGPLRAMAELVEDGTVRCPDPSTREALLAALEIDRRAPEATS